MNNSRMITIVGGSLALALGAAAAAWRGQSLTASADGSAEGAPSPIALVDEGRPIDPSLARALSTENGAKRWLLLLAAAEQATAAEMPALIRAAGADSAVARMLGARWAELDPVHMFRAMHAELLLRDGAPGAMPEKHVLTEVLFDHWAQADPNAVLKALTDVPNFAGREHLRMAVSSQLMKVDVEKGLEALAAWGIRHYTPDLTKVEAWAANNPRRAAETVLKRSQDHVGMEALGLVGKAWAQKDPKEGIEFAAKLNPAERATLKKAVMAHWARRDLAGAVTFANSQTDPAQRAALGPGLVGAWGETDPAGALAWSEENLRGSARVEAIGALVKTAAEKDITSAADLVAGMPPGAGQNRACAAIFETWFDKGKAERAAAFDWLASLPDAKTRQTALERVQWSWVWNEPVAARDFISGPHGKLASESLIRQVASQQAGQNPTEAMQWATLLPEAQRAGAQNAVLERWIDLRPESATSFARELPAGPQRETAIRTVSHQLAWQSAHQAAEWYRSLPAADQKTVGQIFGQNNFNPERKAEIQKLIGGK